MISPKMSFKKLSVCLIKIRTKLSTSKSSEIGSLWDRETSAYLHLRVREEVYLVEEVLDSKLRNRKMKELSKIS